MLRNYNFEEKDLKKMMSGETVNKFAKKYCRNLTRKRPSKANPEGSLAQPYEDILNQPWTPREFCDRCVEFVTSSDGKYGGLINGKKVNNIEEAICYRQQQLGPLESRHNDFRDEYHKNGYNSIHPLPIDDRDICLPDSFSDSIVKPLMRKNQEVRVGSPEFVNVEDCIGLLAKIHKLERLIVQIAGDIAELRFLRSNRGAADTLIFPTFIHKAGDDFLCYDLNTASFFGKDVKTSRFPKHFSEDFKRLSDGTTLDKPMSTRAEALSRPAMAIQRLYAKQGADRFSANPRLYLVRTPPGESPSSDASMRDQFKNFYTLTFEYKFDGEIESHEVKGAQIIFF
jgi:hypothetical protein